MIPVGGTYTIDANEAVQLIEQLKPKVVIPMHYKTQYCDYPIAELTDFTNDLKWKTVELASLELNPLKLQELYRTCVIFQS